MSGLIIARRLRDEFGVEFNEMPTRAHHSRHGGLADTFLVTECSRGRRTQLSTLINWRWNGRRGVEIALCTKQPIRKLARGPLKLELDDDFSSYGTGLFVTAG